MIYLNGSRQSGQTSRLTPRESSSIHSKMDVERAMSRQYTLFSMISPNGHEREALATVARYLARVESATATQMLANNRSRNLEWTSMVRDQCLSFAALCISLLESFDHPRILATDPCSDSDRPMAASRGDVAT